MGALRCGSLSVPGGRPLHGFRAATGLGGGWDRGIEEVGVVPGVNQIEVHPRFTRPALLALCAELGAVVEAYSPLGRGGDLTDPTVVCIAEAHDLTPAQVVLAWHLAEGRVVIPKTVNPERMAQNQGAAEIRLADEDLAALDTLHSEEGRIGGDPDTFSFSQTREDAVERGEGR